MRRSGSFATPSPPSRCHRSRSRASRCRSARGACSTSSRACAGLLRRMDSPLVGRTAELAHLRGEFELAEAERSCRVVTVLGEPGVGKSRLAAELVASLDEPALVLEGRCLPYGNGITYWPLVEIVGRLDLERALEGELDGETLRGRLLEAVGRAEADVSRSDELYWAVRRLLETLARERPVLLVLDDVQWAEPADRSRRTTAGSYGLPHQDLRFDSCAAPPLGCEHGSARAFLAEDAGLVRARVRRPDAGAGAGLARHCLRRQRPDPGADRLRQDARRLPLRDRPARPQPRRRAPPALRLAAEGAQLRRRAEPARPARRPPVRAPRRRPHRRHDAEGAARAGQGAARHPDHDAGVALPDADLAGAGDAALARDGDRGRGARRRGHEARRAPGALAGAARRLARQAGAANRPLRDPAPARRDRPLRLRRPRDPARRRGHAQGARPRGRRAGRGPARARGHERAVPAGNAGRRRDGLRLRGERQVDLALDLPGGPRARPSAPLDDRLRQQPPPRRAARDPARTSWPRKRSRARTTARSRASSA